ncbi:class I SAM-dependent methyltransferase [Streptomyces sp. NPDC059441]|uniref:class I SAM-dependent methyltransferase n=1 Tax=Streptomyces sp. NPDC059441 TaxID=3346829 RepID=UPI0036C88E63
MNQPSSPPRSETTQERPPGHRWSQCGRSARTPAVRRSTPPPQHAGADVTGVDLTEEYVDVARRLTGRVDLADRPRFQQGDVTALPFPRASFDRAWMLHVGMNIGDKASYCWTGWNTGASAGRTRPTSTC